MATFQAVILKGGFNLRSDNTSNIKIRIIHKSVPEYFPTDLYVNPKKFEKGIVKGGDSAHFINSRIRDEIEKYTQRYLKLGDLPQKMTVKELKKRLIEEDQEYNVDFLKFAESHVVELIKQGRVGTARGFNGVISNLKKYQNIIYFKDIDLKFLNDFVTYLKAQGVKNGVDNYMRSFRRLFNAGIEKYNDEDRNIIVIPHYPFKKFKFEKIKRQTLENCLTINEMKLLKNYKPQKDREQMAKDTFLLMFYLIGINGADLYKLKKPDNKGRIKYIRAKTGKEYCIKVEPEVKEIIKRYPSNEYLFNISERYSNYLDWLGYTNKELKSIGGAIQVELRKKNKKATFPQNISTNWARHTWATIARNDCRINKDDIALCLGHEDSDNKVTDIYIKYDYSIIDESNRKVLDSLKK